MTKRQGWSVPKAISLLLEGLGKFMEVRSPSRTDVPSTPANDERQAVQELLDRYFFAIDSRKPDLVGTCFADNARYTSDAGLLHMEGRDAIAGRLGKGGPFAHTAHVRASQEIVIDGLGAAAQTFAIAYLVEPETDGGTVHVRGLCYTDRLERGAEGWKIVTRHHSTKWQFDQPGCPFMKV
jgi:hypothetical protein